MKPFLVSPFLLGASLLSAPASPHFARHDIDAFPGGYQAAVADVNGDGALDVIALSTDNDRVDWYEGPGWKRHPLARTGRNIDCAAADLDRDGKAELALASGFFFSESNRGGEICWLGQPAKAEELWQVHPIAVDPVVHRVRWGDLDGDGRLELVHAPIFGPGSRGAEDPKPAHLWAFRVPADLRSAAWETWKIDETLTVLHGLFVGDLDNDRRDEILTASYEGIHRFDCEGEGSAARWIKVRIAEGAPPPDAKAGSPRGSSEVAPGRLAPGREIVAAIEPWHGNQVVIYTRADPAGAWARRVLDDSLAEGHALALADFDGDGTDEIVAGWRAGGGGLRLYKAEDPAGERWVRSDLDQKVPAECAVAADLNRDGRIDILAVAGRSNLLTWYENRGENRSSGSGETRSFLDARTCFQTNTPYDPRIALAVDAVIVHRHGEATQSLAKAIGSWREKGYLVGRMFFSDSDAANAYWTGKWDGTPHPDDVERDAAGEVVKCAGIRPYMLPTEGWTKYLEEMTAQSIDAGADAILPEEPLAHIFTGYEKSFQSLWVERYGRPWEPERASAEARFLTGQLKNELYAKLEARLAAVTRARAEKAGRKIPFLLPIHSLYSNVAAQLVAPLGTSLAIDGVDGYIGQVWTGPVNWALAHYGSPEKSFFASAYALYDYFVELAAGSGKRLYLLSDPVEDDPNHAWSEFEQWYKHCVVAKLFFPSVAGFEVMPWPDRIFLPGYGTGGGTPAPERNRIAILSAVQVQQEVPADGAWCSGPNAAVSEGIGVAVSDTLLWEREPAPPLQGIYGLILPLLAAGVPVSACILERSNEAAYLKRFRVIVLSYEALKPLDATTNENVARWVRGGGSLIVLGAADGLEGEGMWWRQAGHPSPLHHLLAGLDMKPEDAGDRQIDKGWVLRRAISPRQFADPAVAARDYVPLVERALEKSGGNRLATPGSLCLRRGPFIVAHASRAPLSIPGKLVDIFEPEFPLLDGVALEPGGSGLYRDVTMIVAAAEPSVLHTTHRLMEVRSGENSLAAVIRGPAGTPAVLRIFAAGRKVASLNARGKAGNDLAADWRADGSTIVVRFPNDPTGATLTIGWQ
jgi:hypothetical protein